MKSRFHILYVIFFIITTTIIGCAKQSDHINSTYVSSLKYQGFTCEQITKELPWLKRKIMEVSVQQDIESRQDKSDVLHGILFPPFLFGLASDNDRKEELSRLKGEYEALKNASQINKCNVTGEALDPYNKEK